MASANASIRREMSLYSPGNRRPIGDARGFTLLEVLIAFVIGILALSAMIAVAGSALQASRTSARYQDATVRAQSRLAEATVGDVLTPGEREGDDGGGYHWRVRVTPALGAAAKPGSPSSGRAPSGSPPATPLTLYTVSVRITWQEGAGTRHVQLDTERIGRPMRGP
jgi:general secretion pathway protein I